MTQLTIFLARLLGLFTIRWLVAQTVHLTSAITSSAHRKPNIGVPYAPLRDGSRRNWGWWTVVENPRWPSRGCRLCANSCRFQGCPDLADCFEKVSSRT